MKTKYLNTLSIVLASLALGACDNTSMNEYIDTVPVIESFVPSEGHSGCEISVTGSSLHNVVKATIGGEEAEIVRRISDKNLIIRVPLLSVSGPITLSNSVGTSVSSNDFTMTYPAPEIDTSKFPEQVEVSSKLLIYGKKMGVITRVWFQAEGHEAHEAEILSSSEREIVVTVPYVEADDVDMLLEYFDGTAHVTLNPFEWKVEMLRNQPSISQISHQNAKVGDLVVLSGKYLDKINRVLLDSEECSITSQNSKQLKFMVPHLESYMDGENISKLSIEYSDGRETQVLNSEFKVVVPAILIWEDRTVWAQGKDVEEFTSFFSPHTGLTYSNSLWRELDAVSYQYQDATCSAVQKPAVSEDEYDSVVPYFFFTGVSAGNLQLNSPAGSPSMLKNIFMANSSKAEDRVTGQNGDCYGTPVMSFLTLSEENSAHSTLINLVKSKSLSGLDEEHYPIDTEAKKMGNINIGSMANSLKDTSFAPGVFTVGQEKNTDLDAYILVLYYNHHGLDSDNRALNVKRAGVLHIKHIDFKLYNGTDAPSSSSITFDMYWMKQDYSNQ